MKTRSKENEFAIKHPGRKRARRLVTATIAATGALLFWSPLSRSVVASEVNACEQTAADAFASCRKGAESDYRLDLGICDNIGSPAERANCEKRATRSYENALTLCEEQNTLRLAVCDRLGGTPYQPKIDPANFTTVIDNPYFPLKPGTTFVYEGPTEDGFEHVEFAVTHNTKVILGVTCVEVHDTSQIDGVLSEDTRDWFAQDKQGNVWYFGENTTLVEGGLPVDLTGSWAGGVNGAQPGIIMKAHPAVGDFYRQEFSLGNAEDLAEVKSLNAKVTVPYGSFDHCLKTLESSPLAPGDLENKFYAAGVGNVLTIDLATGDRSELVQIITE
ncbi:MAG: hypothetical protein ABJB49_08335 [Nitrospirota bacterium]